MGKIIAVHSYKGGTGKTIVSTNLAVTFTRYGRKACLMDLDFRAPSLSTIFGLEELDCWLNDYLNGTCRIEKALTNFSGIDNDGELFLGLADPSTEAIRDMSAKDRKWEMRALGRLLSLKNSLTNDNGFDYVILDTSPGLQYSSINAIVAADLVIVATTFDRSDMKGTKRMLHELYELFEKKTEIVVNKVLYDVSSNSGQIELQNKIKEAYQTPVLGVIPCFCDVARAEGAFIFSSEKPEHPFAKIMDDMVVKIEKNTI